MNGVPFPGDMQQDAYRQSLKQEATYALDEARMVLPGVQAILGFQLIAVFNQRFEGLGEDRQVLHLVAFAMVALAGGMLMTPAAFHRQAEPGCVTRRFVRIASLFLSAALAPLILGLAIDAYLIVWLTVRHETIALCFAAGLAAVLASLWYVLPWACRFLRRREASG